MKTEILKMLRETDDYVSGQQICGKLGVSRTAVWKVIRQLQEEGYQIEAVRNRGYRILDGPDVMTREELESLMGTRWAGSRIYYYPETDSTNIRIRQLADEGAPHGTLAVADMQTAGRGRRGRTWESPAGSSIYMSILLRPDLMPSAAPPLTLVMACSVAEGIMDCEDVKVQIKCDHKRQETGGNPDGDEHSGGLYRSCDHRCRHQCEHDRVSGQHPGDCHVSADRGGA